MDEKKSPVQSTQVIDRTQRGSTLTILTLSAEARRALLTNGSPMPLVSKERDEQK